MRAGWHKIFTVTTLTWQVGNKWKNPQFIYIHFIISSELKFLLQLASSTTIFMGTRWTLDSAELRTPFTRKWKKINPAGSSAAVTTRDHTAWPTWCVQVFTSSSMDSWWLMYRHILDT
jgi:hypothetical protein